MFCCFLVGVVDENGDLDWLIPLVARAARTLFWHEATWESRLHDTTRREEGNIMIADVPG